MESWLPAIFGLGGVLIGSLFSLWLTKLQMNNADKKFERELAKAGEDAQRQRRWEVRCEPLLKLRGELALMAVKEARVTGVAYRQHMLKDIIAPAELRRQLEEAIKNRDDYMESGILQQVLNMQTVPELIDRVKKIMQDYQSSHFTAEHYTQFGGKDRKEGTAVFERNESRIIEVQELINKKLEEL